jgi:hypothetical protein
MVSVAGVRPEGGWTHGGRYAVCVFASEDEAALRAEGQGSLGSDAQGASGFPKAFFGGPGVSHCPPVVSPTKGLTHSFANVSFNDDLEAHGQDFEDEADLKRPRGGPSKGLMW